MIFVLVSQQFKREAVCTQGNQIFNTPLQMSIPYELELSFLYLCFVKKYDVVTTVLIRTLRGGFIVAVPVRVHTLRGGFVVAVDGLDISCFTLRDDVVVFVIRL